MDPALANILPVFEKYAGMIEQLMNEVFVLSDKMDALEQQINSVESTVYDEIINPAASAFEEADREERFNEFNSKHGEALGGFNDALRAIEGPDFDLSRKAFDDFDGLDEEGKPSDDEYVATLIEKVQSQLDAIKAAVTAGDAPADDEMDDNFPIEIEAEETTEVPEEKPAGDKDEMAALMEELESYK